MGDTTVTGLDGRETGSAALGPGDRRSRRPRAQCLLDVELAFDAGTIGQRWGATSSCRGPARPGGSTARRALEIAVAGGYNLLFVGPPGSGKTLLSRRLPGILPSLTFEEALETTMVYSVAGMLGQRALVRGRPFRTPHHTVSVAGLAGGGPMVRPGEISLAHNEVLFLDELLEFSRPVLETLRQPLEERSIAIVRARRTFSFPASFQLVAATNPCPCGHLGNPRRTCTCSQLCIDGLGGAAVWAPARPASICMCRCRRCPTGNSPLVIRKNPAPVCARVSKPPVPASAAATHVRTPRFLCVRLPRLCKWTLTATDCWNVRLNGWSYPRGRSTGFGE